MPDQEHPLQDHQPQAPETPRFREIPPDIQKILDDHQQWLKTDGKEGQRADLRSANLQEANLQGATLWEADLRGAKNLTQKQLDSAKTYEKAKLPEYLKKGAKEKATTD